MFQNRVLKRIFGPKRDKVKGECKRLHYEELNGLQCTSILFTKCYSGDQIKKNMDGACSKYGGEERCIQGFGGEI